MRNCSEYIPVSADGFVAKPQSRGASNFRDDLGVLLACDAMLLGRKMYGGSAKNWPGRREPWVARLNAMLKFVFPSALRCAELSFHPAKVDDGNLLCREGHDFNLKLVSTKCFSKIVKLSYELQR